MRTCLGLLSLPFDYHVRCRNKILFPGIRNLHGIYCTGRPLFWYLFAIFHTNSTPYPSFLPFLPLCYRARHGSTGCLEILLYYDGINVNVINRIEGETPLHKAAAYSDPETALEMVQILVNNGGASTKSRFFLFYFLIVFLICRLI